MTPKVSINPYERTPRAPSTTTNNKKSSKKRVSQVQAEQPSRIVNLPPTPITSCKVTVTSTYHIPKCEQPSSTSPKIIEYRDSLVRNVTLFHWKILSHILLFKKLPSQKVPTDSTQINGNLTTPHSDRFTYRARRVQIQPTIEFPPPPSHTEDIENNTSEQHDYEDVNSPLSNKRPSHNLLSNIVPSITTPSTDQSSQQSTKHIASSFGFDTPIEPHHVIDTTMHSNTDTYARDEVETTSSSDEDNNGGSNHIDYLCKSTSTLGIASPGAHTYYA